MVPSSKKWYCSNFTITTITLPSKYIITIFLLLDELLFETALYNKAKFPIYRGRDSGSSTFYCGRKLGYSTIGSKDERCGPSSGPACPDCRDFQHYNRKLVKNKSLEEMTTMELLFQVYDMKIEKEAKGIYHREGLLLLLQSFIKKQNLYPQVVSVCTGVERTGSANWKDDKGVILFQFNPRPDEGKVVMNTFLDSWGSTWGSDESFSLPEGEGPLSVVVKVTKEGYYVTKDDSVLHVYQHRIPFEEFYTIESDDSWTVTTHDSKKHKCDHVFSKDIGKDCECGSGLGICSKVSSLSSFLYHHYNTPIIIKSVQFVKNVPMKEKRHH